MWHSLHGSGPVSVAGDNDAAVTDTESESEYSASNDESSDNESSMDQQRLAEKVRFACSSVDEFYSKFVCVNGEQALSIAEQTRQQSQCAAWFDERRLRVTATMCRAIACR